MAKKDAVEILAESLKESGHDGLISFDRECGCLLSDLILCDVAPRGCVPAYNHGGSGPHDFSMGLPKP